MFSSRTKNMFTLINSILVLALILAIIASALMPSPVRAAPSWPTDTDWRLIDTDANEPGQANYRDITEASWTCDETYLFLRLRTVDPPSFSGAFGPARYKWFIDVGSDLNLYQSGGNILGTDYLLFMEDSNNDGSGEIYLLPASPNDRFSDYEPWDGTNATPITDADIADYRITGNYIDVYIPFSEIGKT